MWLLLLLLHLWQDAQADTPDLNRLLLKLDCLCGSCDHSFCRDDGRSDGCRGWESVDRRRDILEFERIIPRFILNAIFSFQQNFVSYVKCFKNP